jgi:hypothetical protein
VSDTVLVIITGMDQAALPLVSVQPNPANEWITIVWTGERVKGMRLTDMQGRNLLREEVVGSSRRTLSVAHLSEGQYIVELVDDVGFVLTARRILVAR